MYGYETAEQEMMDSILQMLGVFGIFCLIVSLIVIIFIDLGMWKSLKKAGKNGWEALIPIYKIVVLCKISGLNPWWVLITFIAPVILNMIPVVGSILSYALLIYFNFIFNVSIAKSFGKETEYAFGLWFLPAIFWPLLGGKNNSYIAPQAYDPLFSSIFKENTTNSNIDSTNQDSNTQNINSTSIKYCKTCGSEVPNGSKFCSKCGSKQD